VRVSLTAEPRRLEVRIIGQIGELMAPMTGPAHRRGPQAAHRTISQGAGALARLGGGHGRAGQTPIGLRQLLLEVSRR
jgi:hypothetical protein